MASKGKWPTIEVVVYWVQCLSTSFFQLFTTFYSLIDFDDLNKKEKKKKTMLNHHDSLSLAKRI